MELHSLHPQKYPFDALLSPTARSRQCIISYNVRSHELGESLLTLPPDPPNRQFDPDSERIVTEVEVDAPLDKSKLGGRISRLRGSALNADSALAALLPYFSNPEKNACGFVLTIARYRDVPSISIHLQSREGPTIRPGAECGALIAYDIDTENPESDRNSFQHDLRTWTKPKTWQPLLDALQRVAEAPAKACFIVTVHFRAVDPPP
jgi:hypothetical protein